MMTRDRSQWPHGVDRLHVQTYLRALVCVASQPSLVGTDQLVPIGSESRGHMLTWALRPLV